MAQNSERNPQNPLEFYERWDKERLNNSPVGLVTPRTDPDVGQRKEIYAYDLYSVWASKEQMTNTV